MAHCDSQTGEYNETYPLEAFIQALDRLGGDVGTKDVEEAVGCEYRTAIARLHELEDRGIITSRRVGNAYLWSLAEIHNMESRSGDRQASTENSPSEEDGDPLRGTDTYRRRVQIGSKGRPARKPPNELEDTSSRVLQKTAPPRQSLDV